MPPKRSKSGTGSAGVQRWEQGLLSNPFCEEEKWMSSITFVIGNRLSDYSHIQSLSGAVNAGLRRLFSFISKDDLYLQVNELGNPKSKKPKETPQYYEICEPCKQYLDTEEEIPLPLLAKLVKFRLLDIKNKDHKRRENEKKAAAEKDKPNKKGDKKDRSKSPAKGKAGKKTPEPPSAKNESKLRKRGDEDTDSRFIDDEPDDGPQHYVIISGFHQQHLIGFMAELGLNVNSIIKLESDEYPAGDETDAEPAKVVTAAPVDTHKADQHHVVDGDDGVERVVVTEAQKLTTFWTDILSLLRAASEESPLHHIARLEYTVKTKNIPENLDDPDKKLEYGTALFEDIACMIYDLFDAKRQWANYLENLHLLHIPTDFTPGPIATVGTDQSQHSVTPAAPTASSTVPPADGEGVPGETDMRYYNELMNMVPQESVSIMLIVHCMLEQVVAWEEDKELPSDAPKPPRHDGLVEDLAAHVGQLSFALGLTEEEEQQLSADFDRPKRPPKHTNQPLLIDYNDDLTHRLHHLAGNDAFSVLDSEIMMLNGLPISTLHFIERPTSRQANDTAARLQELLTFCTTGGLTQAEIDHALKQFVFECLSLSSADDDTGNISTTKSPATIPWDDPYPYFKGINPADEEMSEVFSSRITSGARSVSLNDAADPNVLQERLEALNSPDTSPEKGSHASRSRERSLPASAKGPTQGDLPVQEGSQPTSRPGSAGILKSTSPNVNESRKSSVHFDGNDDPLLIESGDLQVTDKELGDNLTPCVSIQEQMKEINDCQKINLDQWCFVENLDKNVLLQVLKEAVYTHPQMDTYYHKRDHSLFIALHNPSNTKLCSHISWQNNLHSNLGFRNYLEHIADAIKDWTKQQEAKYDASVLAVEVGQIHKDADDAASRPASTKGKKGRAKSPKKPPSRAKTPSRGSSSERPASSNPYVRAGSLKAKKKKVPTATLR